jgi:hypothetical protein
MKKQWNFCPEREKMTKSFSEEKGKEDDNTYYRRS